jgi:dTDP-4-dehydrorhamnose reductase
MGIMEGPIYLITGATGYLGRRLVCRANTHGMVYAASRRPLAAASAGTPVRIDVADRDAVLRVVDEIKPTVIIHAAAVNPGQGDDDSMWRVNAEGSAHVAEGARDCGSRLVAVSTDVVFDGRRAPYGDDDAASPVNHYGRSKAAGESGVFTFSPDAAVARTSLMYDLEDMDRGTAGFVERLSRGEPLTLFSDVLRNPIRVDTLADALVKLAETTYSGTLNVAGRQTLSREAFGRVMLQHWGVDAEDLIQSSRAADVSDSIPLDLRLVVERAQLLLGMDLAGVDTVVGSASGARGRWPRG